MADQQKQEVISMGERVARAIQVKLDHEFAERGGLAADEMAAMAARAAIEAMREPTDAMVDVGEDEEGSINIWQAMIDAALNEQVAG